MIRVRSYPAGLRVWLLGQRVHHGATGCILVGAFLSRRRYRAAILAATLIAHDRSDWRVWFKRERLSV